jgi:transcription elongation factor Elf1
MQKHKNLSYMCPYCGHVGHVNSTLERVAKNAKKGIDVYCHDCDAVVTGSVGWVKSTSKIFKSE